MPESPEEKMKEKGFSRAKKIVISILLGLAGFFGSGFSLNFSAGAFSLSIVWATVFPLIAAMAYGEVYAFIAGTAGMAFFFPFRLWPDNGWANVPTVAGYMLFFLVHGYFASRRERFAGPRFDPLVVQVPVAVVHGLIVYLSYPFFFSLNPPFWSPSAPDFMPSQTIAGIALKSPLIMFMVTILAAFVMRVPEIRGLLGLSSGRHMRRNGVIFVATLVSSFAVWLIMLLFNDIFIEKVIFSTVPIINSPYEIIGFVIIISAGLASGYALCLVFEKRCAIEEMLRESEETIRTVFENMIDGVLVLNLRTQKFAMANRAMCSMLGYSPEEVTALGVEDIHPPGDLDYVRDKLEMQIRGELVLAPDIPVLRKDGTVFFADVNSTSLHLNAEQCVLGVFHDITGRRRTAEALKATVAEKEVLLRELYHRTKNNMQVITSMLSLQARVGDDERVKSVFRDVTAKIKAMSLVHQILYRSQELSSVNLGEYARELVKLFANIYERRDFKLNIKDCLENFGALIDVATPFGLILSELLANSMKHAFAGRSEGAIAVRLTKEPHDTIMLDYSDDGMGLGEGADPRAQSGLGLKTIVALVEHQLQGAIEFDRAARGFRCVVRFVDNIYKPRV